MKSIFTTCLLVVVISHVVISLNLFAKASNSCGLNQVYAKCGNLCKNKCKSLVEKDCPDNSCDDGCFCGRGMWRNDKGQCVSLDKCFSNGISSRSASKGDKNCGKYQTFSNCGNMCQNSCEGLIDKNCPKNACEDGCFCIAGYWKNRKGKCVKSKQCRIEARTPSKSDDDEDKDDEEKSCPNGQIRFNCGNLCKNTCKGLMEKNCPKKSCQEGCYCKAGTWKTEKGDCVHKPKCQAIYNGGDDDEPKAQEPKETGVRRRTPQKKTKTPAPEAETEFVIETTAKPTCGENEEYISCFSECGRTCNDLDKKDTLICDRSCSAGCFCKEGFVRSRDMVTCVPPKDCPAKRVWGKKAAAPEARNAEPPKPTEAVTQGSTFYTEWTEVVDVSGSSKKPDTGVCPPNEKFLKRFDECGRTCTFLRKPEMAVCARAQSAGCFCEKGFYRGPDKKCVPPAECPPL